MSYPTLKQTVVSAAVFFSLLPALANEGFSLGGSPVPPNLQRAWAATAHIERTARNVGGSSTILFTGSGFLASVNQTGNEATIVTNAHVAGCNTPYHCTYAVRFYTGTDQEIESTDVSLVKDFSELDIAVLKAKFKKVQLPQPVVLNSETSTQAIDQDAAAIGFPNLQVRAKKAWTIERPEDFRHTIQRFSVGKTNGIRPITKDKYPYVTDKVTTTLRLPFAILHNVDTLPGSSGGPIANTNGEVIGMDTGILSPPHNGAHCESPASAQTPGCTYYAVPAQIISQKLVELNAAGM